MFSKSNSPFALEGLYSGSIYSWGLFYSFTNLCLSEEHSLFEMSKCFELVELLAKLLLLNLYCWGFEERGLILYCLRGTY